MSTFEDCLSTFAPYGGNMPLFRSDQTEATVTIIQEDSDEGMSVTRISTPPRTDTSSLLEAINQILGLFNPLDKECDDDKKPPEEKKSPKKGGDNDDEKPYDSNVSDKPESEDSDEQSSKNDK
jgi:hypothetical protein